jgi:AcrR family transcriptional regulator
VSDTSTLKTRRAILDATRDLLEEPGSDGVGMARIAERAGYSRQAVYRHFGSRAGLLRSTLADIDERAGAEAEVARILDSADALATIDALVSWWGDYVGSFIGVARNVHAGRVSDPELAAAWEDRMQALLEVCRMVVGRCAEEGLLRAELGLEAAAEMLWGVLSVPLWDQLVTDRGWSRSEYQERVGILAREALTATSA